MEPTSNGPQKKRRLSTERPLDPDAMREIEQLAAAVPLRREMLIEALHQLQDRHGHLSITHLNALAKRMRLSAAEVYETATFYHHFDVIREDQRAPPPLTVRICDSIGCRMAGAEDLLRKLAAAAGDALRIQRVSCVGRCATAPVAVVGQNPLPCADVKGVLKAVAERRTEAPLLTDPFFSAYCRDGGYRTLLRCYSGELGASEILQALQQAGLRGLGGAGFPVGRKWRIVREQPAPRLMAVNIDEGEPGTFKDRHYLESDPHRFLEGMLIAARVVQVEKIYIYLRDEYASCRRMLQRELEYLQAHFPEPLPEIDLRRGAGAYICGEESAMIESIEGKRGMPRLRPPYLAEVGLFDRPTLVQNLESLYWVRDILERGAAWFAGQGRHGRQGLRSYSVSGRVNRPGMYLAPAGITVCELLEEYCNGMLPGHEFYGYLPGGASGGILPASLGDLPLDFDTLTEYGCFIGSAAVIVLSDHDRARDVALDALRFFARESCGQCTPCRVGTAKAVDLLAAPTWNQQLLRELGETMRDASICGLGQAAPNPIDCVMDYFPHEIEPTHSVSHGSGQDPEDGV